MFIFHLILLTLFIGVTRSTCVCDRSFSPVCGSDGMTYNNHCQLECADNVRLVYEGTCCPLPYCPPYISAVCDNQNNTHSNECLFNYNKCIVKKSYGRALTIASIGACAREDGVELCSTAECVEDSPVCDVKGVTHESLCHFHADDCRRRAIGDTPLIMAYKGECFIKENDVDELPFEEENIVMDENVPLADTTVPPSTVRPLSLPSLIVTQPPLTANPMSGTFGTAETVKTTTSSPISTTATVEKSIELDVLPLVAPPTLPLPKVQIADRFSIDTQPVSINPLFMVESAARQCSQLACESLSTLPPVCDHTGYVHTDECAFQIARCLSEIVDVDDGLRRVPCADKRVDMSCEAMNDCTKEYVPVCDSDGRTHANLCLFELNACVVMAADGREVTIVSEGECTPIANHQVDAVDVLDAEQFECRPPSCEGEPNAPLCDSEGTTHPNMCTFHSARCLAAESRATVLTIAYDGECIDASMVCAAFCPPDLDAPLCADNLVTYKSECHFRNARCEQHSLDGSVMQVLFNESCAACIPRPGTCTTADDVKDEETLVCDSMQTTRSECEFKITDCIYYKKFDEHLKIAHRGRCCTPCLTPSLDDEPLCDTSNVTHSSMCEFEYAACTSRNVDGIEIGIKYGGECSAENDLRLTAGGQVEETTVAGTEPTAAPINCDEPCESNYKPVCDISTQTTFMNKCEFEKLICDSPLDDQKISQNANLREGECCEVDCPKTNMIPHYICGSDGITHNSLCEFSAHRCRARQSSLQPVEIAKYGVCTQSIQCVQACDDSFSPVCGTDGRTYVNACHLSTSACISLSRGDDVTVAHVGECCSLAACTFEYSPVCDSRRVTHINSCVFDNAQCSVPELSVVYEGECCEKACTKEYAPVCDSANKTHPNECMFEIAQCLSSRQGDALSVAYAGECCTLECSTMEETSPVCDSDGVTHASECRLSYHICMTERRERRTVRYVHDGECCASPICTKEYTPLCGTDGVTYGNRCQFSHRACITLNMHNVTVDVKYNGECCVNRCEGDGLEVCDQNGAVYTNKCHFDVVSCEAQRTGDNRLRLLSPCPPRSHQTRQRRLDRLSHQHQ